MDDRSVGLTAEHYHARGQAADFECYGIANNNLFEWATKTLTFDQAILEFYTGEPESG